MLKGKGIISDLQKRLLLALHNLSDSPYFYLTGGTALAEFYFGHRKSYDLDIFTSEQGLVLPFSRIVEEKLKKIFPSLNVVRRFSSFVEFEISQEDEIIKLQFAYDSLFRFKDPVDSDLGIKINNYKDLVVDKFLAFFGRVEPRDAIDLFFILQREDIEKIAELAAQKDPGFDMYWLAVALEKVKDFPDNISKWPVEMLIDIEIEKLKNAFFRLSIEVMEKIKKKK